MAITYYRALTPRLYLDSTRSQRRVSPKDVREIRSSSSRKVVVKLKDLRLDPSPLESLPHGLGSTSAGAFCDRKAWAGLAGIGRLRI